MATQEDIHAAYEEMEALYERGVRDAVLMRGEQGTHTTDENCWCCPEIRRYYCGTMIIHKKKM